MDPSRDGYKRYYIINDCKKINRYQIKQSLPNSSYCLGKLKESPVTLNPSIGSCREDEQQNLLCRFRKDLMTIFISQSFYNQKIQDI